MQPNNKAVLYARVSSKEQEKEGYSIPAQLKLLKDYTFSKGLDLVREFGDVETAKQSGREGFGEMVSFLKKNHSIKVLLVEKTDRLYRNFKDYVILEDLDLDIHLVKEGSILSKSSKSSEKLMHNLKVVLAKNYIDNLSEEASKGMRQKAEEGMWPSIAPVGYINILGPNGKKVISPDPTTAPLIVRLFEQYATGNYNLKQITKTIKEGGLAFRKSQRPLPKSTIHGILKNRVYMGEFVWKGKVYKGAYTPLISKDLWQKVQYVLEGRFMTKSRATRQGFTYSGFVKCAHCGCALVGEMKKGKYVYYHCSGYKGDCGEPYTREENIEGQLVEYLKQISMSPEILEWLIATLKQSHTDETQYHTQSLDRLNDEYRKVKSKLESMYEDKLQGRIDGDLYDKKAKECREEQDRLLKAIQTHQSANQGDIDEAVRLLELAHNAHKDFQIGKAPQKRGLLKEVLEGATWKSGVLEPRFKEHFYLLALSNRETEMKKPLEVGSEGFNRIWLPVMD